MHDNMILSLDDAARLVHATPETLLQYIRRGELMAARVGKNFVVTHAALSAFVNALATRQSMERQAKQLHLEHAGVTAASGVARTRPAFVQVTGVDSAGLPTEKRRGRRTQLPVLTTPST